MSEVAASHEPVVSIVIPVYNEEAMLARSLEDYRAALQAMPWDYEIIVAQNGSKDRTADIANEMAQRWPEVQALHVQQPNYGAALRAGIVHARGTYIVCEEIDLCDADFAKRAIDVLQRDGLDLVIGSKAMKGAHDQRPLFRRVATRVYNGVLRVALGFRGTDTHGLKALRRVTIVPIAQACIVEHDVFASELVIRTQRSGLLLREIAITLHEKRQPSIGLWKRVPRVMRQIWRLFWAIRFSLKI